MKFTIWTILCLIPGSEGGAFLNIGYGLVATQQYLAVGADNTIFLMEDIRIDYKGTLRSFSAYFANGNAVMFGIWRPDPAERGKYTLVGAKMHIPESAPSANTVILKPSEFIRVFPNDIMGIMNQEGMSSVAYTYFDTTIPSWFKSIDIDINETIPVKDDKLNFSFLKSPYKFSVGCTYYTDDDVPPNVSTTIPSYFNVSTPSWLTTETSQSTTSIATLTTVPLTTTRATTPNETITTESSSLTSTTPMPSPKTEARVLESDDVVLSRWMVIIILVWCGALTIAYFILITCLIYRRRKKKQYIMDSLKMIRPPPLSPLSEIEGMKGETVMDYFLPQIRSESSGNINPSFSNSQQFQMQTSSPLSASTDEPRWLQRI
ncbi:unnamed protein product [Owenia fusiformis]|uniref:Uncharacterized protein n=1 Tax=Owenia fusiformis TaxID=6347 RepID=A0A8S4N383_OWEFU|nr:unnamed protein product [Owenia fusiformis]